MTEEAVHQGRLVKEYRKSKKWSREKLASALYVDVSTIYRMEQQRMIKDTERRRLLVGLLGIPAALMGLGEIDHFLNEHIAVNADHMAFFEEEIAARWGIYHTGGTVRAQQGFDIWLNETEIFAHSVSSGVWRDRARAVLVMSYQLQGSLLRDLTYYDAAHVAYQKSYVFAKELNDSELMAAALARQGVTSIQSEQVGDAIEYLSEALRLIHGLGLPYLKGYILQALSEAYGQKKQARESWHCIDLAERALEHRGETVERSHCQMSTTSVTAQKGVNAVLLADYERAIALIDKGLMKYDPTLVRGRSRLLAQKAQALYGRNDLYECLIIAEEAFIFANAVGSKKTVARLQQLQTSLASSRWKNEPGVARLGALLW